MSLSLDQYISYLDSRALPWPDPPPIKRAPAGKARLKRLPDVRALTWNPYGTLACLAGGEMWFEHPKEVIMDMVLEKTIHEFKMWQSMSRKPGQPSEYFRPLYLQTLNQQRLARGADKYPEVAVDRVWQALIKKLLQKDYRFDAGFYGSLNEFSCKVAYFFHASLQAINCFPHAASALKVVMERGWIQGLLGDGQCFTRAQLNRCLAAQDPSIEIGHLLPLNLSTLSYEVGSRRPSERLFRAELDKLAARGIQAPQVLHIGSDIERDVVPAKRLGMRSALYVTEEQASHEPRPGLRQAAGIPDLVLTDLIQIREVLK